MYAIRSYYVTFEDCTGIEENDMLLSVYPNPSNGMFTISAEGMNTEMFIEVISPEGRVVRQIYSTESITAIDLTGENAGVYYVKIQIEDQVKVLVITSYSIHYTKLYDAANQIEGKCPTLCGYHTKER